MPTQSAGRRATAVSCAEAPAGIPNYVLTQFIAAGGFGEVWLATELLTGVRRAIKIVRGDGRSRARIELDGVRRYQRCAHNHPNLLSIHTVGELDDGFYYVMELADADSSHAADSYEPLTLRSLLAHSGRFAARDALELVAKLARGVARLHREGLAHHDLKPENVLFVDGEPRIFDVGLVSHQQCDSGGTAGYLTPEGAANDCYALGIMLYELITGEDPRSFPRLPAALAEHPSRELTAAIEIADRAAHPEAAQRARSVADLSEAISRALGQRRGWRPLAGGGAVVGVLLVLATAWALGAWTQRPVEDQPMRPAAAARATEQVEVPLTVEGWQPGPTCEPLRYPQSCVALSDGGLGPECWHTFAIPNAGGGWEHFALDLHVVALRPHGDLLVRVGARDDANDAVELALRQQPTGLGIYSRFAQVDPDGFAQNACDLVRLQPLPGVEYVLRIATVGDDLVAALWPLSRPIRRPLVIRMEGVDPPPQARFVSLRWLAGEPLASVRLLGGRIARLSAPLDRIDADECLPPEVTSVLQSGPRSAWMPALAADAPPVWGELLKGAQHPLVSDAWHQIGGWSWIAARDSKALPSGGDAAAVRCMPFSAQERTATHSAAVYAGVQRLCFNGGRYGDFEMCARIRLRSPPDVTRRDPFVSLSEGGAVGLFWGFQDESTGAFAWGASNRALLSVDQADECELSIGRYDALGVSALQSSLANVVAVEPQLVVRVPVERERVFSPEGFALRVLSCGGRAELYLDDESSPRLRWNEPDGAKLPPGRIGLQVTRLIATYESIELRPAPGAAVP